MFLPVYFVRHAGESPPPGRFAACGWHCLPDGTLFSPPDPGKARALVFDDRTPIPAQHSTLTASLLHAAERLGAEVIILDFERPESTCACEFARMLAEGFPTAAPDRFCSGACTPIFCYNPEKQTFARFLLASRGWIELRPIDQTLRYDSAGPGMSRQGQAYFSKQLECMYQASAGEDGLVLRLFDTPETFQARLGRLQGRFSAAVGLCEELRTFGIDK